MRHIVEGTIATINGEREPYTIEIDAISRVQAVMLAVQTAEMRGKRFRAEAVTATYDLVGFCRVCEQPVFTGGEGRSRRGELRCYDCGGSP